MKNSLWKRVWTCRKTDYRIMNENADNKTVQATYRNKYEYYNVLAD